MANDAENTAAPYFVQYTAFKVDPAWRRLPREARADGREAFARAVEERAPQIATWAYSTIGMKAGADLLLWRRGADVKAMQEMTARLLQTGLGVYSEITYQLWGFTRPSSYTRRPTTQEQAVDLNERQTYLVVYPFSKTTEWYLMSRDARQGMMNEHMRVGHEYADIRQVLLYATGLDDQEFVVAYECEDLPRFSQLVVALRDTEARRYTLKDTPIITGIHRPLREALELIG
ncbi:MAG TPA: chlorite dismutase family protein [Roseiflexaceae bacterium]|nr:chlorite dismutase family protein [Roseiflexaceae bacterium]